jgi:hypothetical protein
MILSVTRAGAIASPINADKEHSRWRTPPMEGRGRRCDELAKTARSGGQQEAHQTTRAVLLACRRLRHDTARLVLECE